MVKFLVEGLASFVPKGVGIIIDLEDCYREIQTINFRVMGALQGVEFRLYTWLRIMVEKFFIIPVK